MPAIQCRSGRDRILFQHTGKQHAFTLGEVFQEEAETKAAQVDYLLLRLKQRLAVIPPGIEIVKYSAPEPRGWEIGEALAECTSGMAWM